MPSPASQFDFLGLGSNPDNQRLLCKFSTSPPKRKQAPGAGRATSERLMPGGGGQPGGNCRAARRRASEDTKPSFLAHALASLVWLRAPLVPTVGWHSARRLQQQ